MVDIIDGSPRQSSAARYRCSSSVLGLGVMDATTVLQRQRLICGNNLMPMCKSVARLQLIRLIECR